MHICWCAETKFCIDFKKDILQLKKESTKRSDVSLDGVFHPEQIQAEGTENIENKSTPMEMNPIDCVEQTSGDADLEAGVDIYEKEGGEDNYNSARAGETDAKQDQESASAVNFGSFVICSISVWYKSGEGAYMQPVKTIGISELVEVA